MGQDIQLYSLATPNGQKVSVALEEMEIPYQAHMINILKGDQFTNDFIKINPNSKIPAIVDPVGDNGKALSIMESGAILIYLAEKSDRFLSNDSAKRNQQLQWLFFQVGGVGPMFGQFGHFYRYSKEKCDHPYPVDRYATETKRILGVMEKQLTHNPFIAGDELSIADFATFPWVVCLDKFYKASESLELKQFSAVNEWVAKLLDRPKVQTGMKVCAFD